MWGGRGRCSSAWLAGSAAEIGQGGRRSADLEVSPLDTRRRFQTSCGYAYVVDVTHCEHARAGEWNIAQSIWMTGGKITVSQAIDRPKMMATFCCMITPSIATTSLVWTVI